MRELLAFAASVAVIGAAGLQLHGPPAAAKEDVRAASALLSRVARSSYVPYRAVQTVAYYGEPQSNALLDVQSSEKGRFVRARSGGVVSAASASPKLRPDDVLAKYAVDVGGKEELLGVEVVPLTFRRGDGSVSEKWWVHEKSGVVYRRDVYDAAGKVVGMSLVIDMEWGDPGPTPAQDVVASSARPTRSREAPARLSGSYALWRTFRVEVGGEPADQWVYSDGLHALSVFRMHGGLKAPRHFSRAGDGLWKGPGPGTWAWEGAGKSYIVVAEEAGLDAAELVAPFPNGGPSLAARLGSVWSRLFDLL